MQKLASRLQTVEVFLKRKWVSLSTSPRTTGVLVRIKEGRKCPGFPKAGFFQAQHDEDLPVVLLCRGREACALLAYVHDSHPT